MKHTDRAYRRIYETLMAEALAKSPENYYDDSALPSYTHRNKLMSWLFWKRVDVALGLAQDMDGKSVLDFGCGAGVTFRHLGSRGCSVTGCDNLSYELAADIARRLGVGVEMVRDLSDIGEHRFDYIFALDVLEHMEDPSQYVRRFLEISHNGTVIIVSGPTESLPYRIGRKMAGFSGHYHKTNIFDVEKALKASGLKRIRNVSLPTFPVLFRVSSWRVG